MVDLLGIISFFLLSLVVRKLVVGYLKDTNAGECRTPQWISESSVSCEEKAHYESSASPPILLGKFY